MPLYFFHLSGSSLWDAEGEEFADDNAARNEAYAVAKDLSRNQHTVSEDRIVVTDAHGAVIHEEPLFRR